MYLPLLSTESHDREDMQLSSAFGDSLAVYISTFPEPGEESNTSKPDIPNRLFPKNTFWKFSVKLCIERFFRAFYLSLVVQYKMC